MGWSYHKSQQILPGVRLNVSKRGGLGVSFGTKGARVSMNKQGVRTSIGGHGLYYRKQESWGKKKTAEQVPPPRPMTREEILSTPESLKQYNQAALSKAEGKAFKWFVILAVAALIVGAFTGMIGFYIIFPIDCIVFLWFTISGVRHMFQYNKAGKILFMD